MFRHSRWAGPARPFRLIQNTALVACVALGSVPYAFADELVVNGGFEFPVVTAEQGWMSYYGENAPDDYLTQPENYCPEGTPPQLPECQGGTPDTVPGWSVFWQDTIGEGLIEEAGRLEIQTNNPLPSNGKIAGGIVSNGGNQKAELDGHYRDPDYTDDIKYSENVIIAQTIATCARTPYEFSYHWKARYDLPGDNDILVLIDDEVVLTNTEYKDHWTRESYKFLANGTGESILGFTSVGHSNTYGMLLDDVSIQGQNGMDPESCAPPPPICANPNSLTLLYDADLDGEDFFAQDETGVVVDTYSDGLPTWVQVRVYDAVGANELFVSTVRIGQTFTFTGAGGDKVPAELLIELSDLEGTVLQTISFRADQLSVGEEMGGIGVWSADCQCDCVCEETNQSYNIDFVGLVPDQEFNGETYAGFGVHISHSVAGFPMQIQDTSDPGLDPASQDHYNTTQGNALIVSKYQDPVSPGREYYDPHSFYFDFDTPVFMKSITTMDQEVEGSKVHLYDEGGALISTVDVPVVGDSVLQVVDINVAGVSRAEFFSKGSTFIDDIAYYIPCGEECSCDCDGPQENPQSPAKLAQPVARD